nr:reverse transcriptase domain-containing protein [Tanacetum cinerariifolium]
MEELCQPSLNGRGGPIAPISTQAMNFGLQNNMIQQVHNFCQFHGLPGDDANKHLDKFLHVTQRINVNGVTDDAIRLYLFPHSLTHHATAWFDRLLRNSINTFEQMAKMFLGKHFPPSMVTKLKNEITNFHQRPDESLFKAWEPTVGQTQNVYAAGAYQGNSYQPQGNCNLLSYRSDNYLGPPCFNHNQNQNNQNQNFQNQNKNQGNFHPQGKNQGRNQFFQGANQGQNPPPAYQASGYQALVHQPQIPQPQVVTTNEFTNFMKAKDAILKNMQTNMTSLTNSNLELKNMFGQFVKMNTALSSGSRTLPGNTITNPKEELKGITTRSETAYQGPTIHTTSSSLPPVVEREIEATKDTVHPTNNESTEDVQPLVVLTESLILNSEPIVAPIIEPLLLQLMNTALSSGSRTLPGNTITNPKEELKEKLGDPGKFLIPCDFLGMAECLALADLGASINLMPLSMWNKLSLTELTPTLTTLELADRSIFRSIGVAEDVYVKVRKFHFPADFVVVDFDADPRVPLILERSFLKTRKALIDVFEGKLTLRVGKAAITFHLDQTSRYSANYNDMTELKICEAKSDKSSIDEPSEVELKDLPPHLKYAFLEGDDKLPVIIVKDLSVEEKTALITVLKSHNIWVSPVHCIPKKGGFTVVENEENELIPTRLVTGWRVYIDYQKMLKRCEETNLCMNWEKSHFMVKEGIVLDHKISKEGIEVDKAKVDVIAKLPHPTTVKGVRMVMSASTEAPILIAPDWDLPFKLMCDASDFAIGAVLGQRQEKHFRPIHYASKTMTEEESNYTITEKEMLAVVYAFEKFWSYLIMNKSIVYMDHSALKYLFAKKDSKARFLLKIFSGKLKSRCSGPFTISHVFPYDTVELSQPDGPNFKVNGQRFKHYFGEDIPKMVVPDLQTFPKDQ